MRKLLLIALLAVASAAEAQNVVPAAAAPQAPAAAAPQAPAPAPAAQPPAPVRPPSAPRPASVVRVLPGTVPAAPEPPSPPRPAANIRFDVTITDTGGAKPVTKTLSLTIGNNNNSGSIRSTAQVPFTNPNVPNVNPFVGPPTSIPLNVDVRSVTWVDNNAVRANVLIEYQPYVPEAKIQPGGITASAQTVFFDGRKTQILVTSDPISDRKTTIEVTATLLK